MDKETEIIKQIEDSIDLKRHLQGESKILITIANAIVQAFQRGNKVLLFGNGGSASDAQHIACELAGKFYRDRDPLPAMALTTNTSSLTAIGNDYGYEEVFARQVKGSVKKGDVVIGISTSGNSPNVLRGIEEANRLGAITIAFTGQGGKLRDLANYVLSIPSTDTPRIQEAHITAGHIICYLVEETLFGDPVNMNKAVFMDRDGTIARDIPYCSRPEDFELLPGAAEGIKLLNNHDFKVIIITNQSGIARGYFSEEMLAKIHDKMRSELVKHEARVDAIYYCPHHPNDSCDCRKPRPKLALQAVDDFSIDLKHSFVVGDHQMDIELGKAMGCKTILIGDSIIKHDSGPKPDAIVPNILEAVRSILNAIGRKQ